MITESQISLARQLGAMESKLANAEQYIQTLEDALIHRYISENRLKGGLIEIEDEDSGGWLGNIATETLDQAEKLCKNTSDYLSPSEREEMLCRATW